VAHVGLSLVKSIKSYFCSAPWVSVAIMESGGVKTCCAGKPFGNVNKQSIYEIIDSEYLAQTKRDILDNKPTDNCASCYQQERQTGTSLRDNYNLYYTDITKGIQAIDLRRSNLCNLACIYCGPQASSTWATQLNKPIISFKNTYDIDLETWLSSKLENIQEITLLGGEPLLMKENYALIDKIPDNVRLSITTNLTIDLERLPIKEKLLEKKNLIWNISADNYGKKFEYVRNGASWQQFEKNLNFLHKNGITVSILLTYGIFSGLCLADTVKHFYNMGVNNFIIGSVAGRPVLDLFNYPKLVLSQALKEIQDTVEWQKKTFKENYYTNQILSIDNFAERLHTKINSADDSTINKRLFLNEIERYDTYTADKFADLWVNEYNLIIESLSD
jgi:MoaA/NifB/PqqE/SkfB family radical SAM enzyme